MSTKSTEVKRGRGRPKSFPGQETAAILSNIPIDTANLLRELATKRGEALNITLDRIIVRSHKEAMRTRSKSKSKNKS